MSQETITTKASAATTAHSTIITKETLDLDCAVKAAIWKAQRGASSRGSRASKPVRFDFVGECAYELPIKNCRSAGSISRKGEEMIAECAAALRRGMAKTVSVFRNMNGGVTVSID